jgi:hypothetical protein
VLNPTGDVTAPRILQANILHFRVGRHCGTQSEDSGGPPEEAHIDASERQRSDTSLLLLT